MRYYRTSFFTLFGKFFPKLVTKQINPELYSNTSLYTKILHALLFCFAPSPHIFCPKHLPPFDMLQYVQVLSCSQPLIHLFAHMQHLQNPSHHNLQRIKNIPRISMNRHTLSDSLEVLHKINKNFKYPTQQHTYSKNTISDFLFLCTINSSRPLVDVYAPISQKQLRKQHSAD